MLCIRNLSLLAINIFREHMNNEHAKNFQSVYFSWKFVFACIFFDCYLPFNLLTLFAEMLEIWRKNCFFPFFPQLRNSQILHLILIGVGISSLTHFSAFLCSCFCPFMAGCMAADHFILLAFFSGFSFLRRAKVITKQHRIAADTHGNRITNRSFAYRNIWNAANFIERFLLIFYSVVIHLWLTQAREKQNSTRDEPKLLYRILMMTTLKRDLNLNITVIICKLWSFNERQNNGSREVDHGTVRIHFLSENHKQKIQWWFPIIEHSFNLKQRYFYQQTYITHTVI